MKTKRVVNKKTGKVYEYPAEKYNYKHKSKRGLTLVSSKGVKYTKNIDKFKAIIDANEDYSETYKIFLKSDLDVYVATHKNDKRKATTTGFFGYMEKNEIAKMFANAGYTPLDVAERLGVTEDYLLDTKNWTADGTSDVGSKLYIRDKDGEIIKAYQFTFTYTGDILTEVI